MTVTHKRRKQSTGDDSGGIKYHCDKCRRDVTDTIRVRCAECPDFDLCVECFSKGVESDTHRNDHSYRLLDRFAFPLMDENWGADEEWLLVEGLGLYGMGNWADVAGHVGTKTLEECEEHYLKFYVESPSFPLPNLSIKLDEDKISKARKERQQSPSKNLSIIPPFKAKVLPSVPANHEVQGFMPLRMEFDYEPENEAEHLVKDLVFSEDDLPQDVELKLALLEIYNHKLDIREERKRYIFDRNLVQFKQLQNVEKKRSREEKELYNQTKVLSPLMTAEDYDSLVQGILLENQIKSRIAQLQEYRRMGVTSFAGAEEYEVAKKQRLNSVFSKSPFFGSDRITTKQQNRLSIDMGPDDSSGLGLSNLRRTTDFQKLALEPLDLTGCECVDQLTSAEQELCSSLRLLPRAYLAIKQTLLKESQKRGGLKRRDARTLVRVDVNKLGKVFDFLVLSGWIRHH